MKKRIAPSKMLAAGVMFTLMVPWAGCRLVKTTTELPGKAVSAVNPLSKPKPNIDVVDVQQNLLRFADEFSGRMFIGFDELRVGTNEVDLAQALRWKVGFASQISSIVSGPNPIANLLDMTVLVSLTRMAVEQTSQSDLYGESIQPVIEISRTAETAIWRQAALVLSAEQQSELRKAIEEWYRKNPLPGAVLAARAVGFASQLQREMGKTEGGSVFDLLSLDPLAGLDPAVRELAQTRMFAERALYVAHRTPQLLRWQAELMAIESTSIPAVQQLLTNSAQISSSVERFAAVAEKLPGQITAEREEILKGLQSQEPGLRSLVDEVKQALVAGTQMSTSLNTTLTTLDVLMKRFGVGETNKTSAPKTNAEPFRIRDYTETAAQLEATARQLTALVVALDNTVGSSNITHASSQVVNQAQTSSQELVNYIFWKGVLLIVIAAAVMVLYRTISSRLTTSDVLKPKSH